MVRRYYLMKWAILYFIISHIFAFSKVLVRNNYEDEVIVQENLKNVEDQLLQQLVFDDQKNLKNLKKDKKIKNESQDAERGIYHPVHAREKRNLHDITPGMGGRSSSSNSISLGSDGGYANILISFDDKILKNYAAVDDIFKIVQDFSNRLYTSTENRLWVKSVKLVLPKFWGSPPSAYEKLVSAYQGIQNINNVNLAVIKVLPTPARSQLSRSSRTLPPLQAIKSSPCGESGTNMRIFVDSIGRLRQDSEGTSKLFLKEWAKYRFGVFDEKPLPNRHTYVHSDSKIYGTRCSLNIKGQLENYLNGETCTDKEKQKNGEDCRFVPNSQQEGSSLGSLMYSTNIPGVDKFCNASNHNSEAPTVHNLRCDFKSAWEIISSHSDIQFIRPNKGLNAPPSTDFAIFHEGVEKICLLLDASTSMLFGKRLFRVRQAALNYISMVPTNNYIGIVTFHKKAVIRAVLTKIRNEDTRKWLAKRLPVADDISRGTSIAAGVNKCLQVISDSSSSTGLDLSSTSGGKILLLSDGTETDSPYMNEVLYQSVKSSLISVTSIAFGQDATRKLEEIAKATGGSNYFASPVSFNGGINMGGSNQLEDAFMGHLEQMKLISLISNSTDIFSNSTEKYTFLIDHTASTMTTITLNYDRVLVAPEVELYRHENYMLGQDETAMDDILLASTKGNKFMYRDNSEHIRVTISHDEDLDSYTIKIFGKLPVGPYTVIVQNRDTERLEGQLLVTTFPNPDIDPITLKVSITDKKHFRSGSKKELAIFAHIAQGDLAVLDATIVAIITRPLPGGSYMDKQTDIVELKLLDDGIGEDVNKNDGVYSGTFIRFTTSGRYSVQVFAKSNQKFTYISNNHLLGTGIIDISHRTLRPRPIFLNRLASSGMQIRIEKDVKLCEKGWDVFGKSCYKFLKSETYYDAVQKCSEGQMLESSKDSEKNKAKATTGRLLTIETFNELRFILATVLPKGSEINKIWISAISMEAMSQIQSAVQTFRKLGTGKFRTRSALNSFSYRGSSSVDLNEALLDQMDPDVANSAVANAFTYSMPQIKYRNMGLNGFQQRARTLYLQKQKFRPKPKPTKAPKNETKEANDLILNQIGRTTNGLKTPSILKETKPNTQQLRFGGACQYISVDPNAKNNMHLQNEKAFCEAEKMDYVCEVSTIDNVEPAKIMDLVVQVDTGLDSESEEDYSDAETEEDDLFGGMDEEKVSEEEKLAIKNEKANLLLDMSWTSPGDDLNEGSVAEYTIYYTGTLEGLNQVHNSNKDNLRSLSMTSTTDENFQPSKAGIPERKKLDLSSLKECPEHSLMDVFFLLNVAQSAHGITIQDHQRNFMAMAWTQLNLKFTTSYYETQLGLFMTYNKTVETLSPLGQWNNVLFTFKDLHDRAFPGGEAVSNMTYPYDQEMDLANMTDIFSETELQLEQGGIDNFYYKLMPVYLLTQLNFILKIATVNYRRMTQHQTEAYKELKTIMDGFDFELDEYPQINNLRYPRVPITVGMIYDMSSYDYLELPDEALATIGDILFRMNITITPIIVGGFANATRLSFLNPHGEARTIRVSDFYDLTYRGDPKNRSELLETGFYIEKAICNNRGPETRIIAISSSDEYGNESPLSNPFSLVVEPRYMFPRDIPWQDIDPTRVSVNELIDKSGRLSKRGGGSAAASSSILSTFGMVIGFVMLMGWKRRRDKAAKAKKAKKDNAADKMNGLKNKMKAKKGIKPGGDKGKKSPEMTAEEKAAAKPPAPAAGGLRGGTRAGGRMSSVAGGNQRGRETKAGGGAGRETKAGGGAGRETKAGGGKGRETSAGKKDGSKDRSKGDKGAEGGRDTKASKSGGSKAEGDKSAGDKKKEDLMKMLKAKQAAGGKGKIKIKAKKK